MAFGMPDVKGMMAKLEERFQQLIAEIRTLGDKLDVLIEQGKKETGAITFGPIVGAIVIVLAIIGLFAICNESENDADEFDGLSQVELVSHEYDERPRCYEDGYCDGDEYDQWNSDQRNHNRRNRGAFSPGPFDDSPIRFENVCISVDCSGRERRDDPPPEERP